MQNETEGVQFSCVFNFNAVNFVTARIYDFSIVPIIANEVTENSSRWKYEKERSTLLHRCNR